MSQLLRSNLVVASGTAISRISGLVRNSVFVAALGSTALSAAYVTANDTPNIIYDLLLGGVLSATLVPLFTSYLPASARSEDRGSDGTSPVAETPREFFEKRRATNVIITTSAVLMVLLTLVAVILAPLIFYLYSVTTADNVSQQTYRQVGTILTRVFLLQILFYGLVGIGNAYLNSRRRFMAAAWSPIAANVVIILSFLSLPGYGTRRWRLEELLTDARLRVTLGLGATLGIGTMAAIVVIAMFRSGLRYRPEIDLQHPAVRRLLTLSGWTLGFVAANQVAVVFIRNVLNGVAASALPNYFAAFMFFVLPHGLLGVSVSTTYQPELARAVTDGDTERFVSRASQGIDVIAALTLPAGIFLLVAADRVMRLLQRGNFTGADASQAALALMGLSIGLGAFSIYQFTLRGFYAHQDTRTPFLLNVGENAFNIVSLFPLVALWGIFGAGLSYGLAYVVFSAAALVTLHRKVPSFRLRPVLGGIARSLLATAVMGAALVFANALLPTTAGLAEMLPLTLLGIVGLMAYIAALLIQRATVVDVLRSRIDSARRR